MAHDTDARPRSVGERIHEIRALRGYSLRELAAAAFVSKTALNDVERGVQQPSEQFIAAVARALSVSVSVLHGQPYIEQLRRDQLDRVIAPLSRAMDSWGIPPEDDDPPPRSVQTLLGEVPRIRSLRSAAAYSDLAGRLPSLLGELSHAALIARGRDREQAYWALAEASLGVFTVGYKLGYMDLARLALARMESAAILSGDPRQVGAERVKRAILCADGAGLEQGLRLVRQGLRDLDDDGTEQTKSVRGALLLKGIQLHALAGNGDESDVWLEEAQGLARETGEINHYLMVFGPTNVAQHAVAAAGDRDEHGLAVDRARQVRLPDGYDRQRAGVYWIDRARSEALTARPEDALTSLEEAREVTPQQTRYHPTTRETVGILLRARSRASERLRRYAEWSGV